MKLNGATVKASLRAKRAIRLKRFAVLEVVAFISAETEDAARQRLADAFPSGRELSLREVKP